MARVEFYNHIRQIRIMKGMTARDLAQRSGVSASTISKLEKGAYQPSIEVGNKLAEALGVDPDELRGFNSPYVQSTLAPPRRSADYLCAFRVKVREPYRYQVFHFDITKQEWTLIDGSAIVNPNYIKWWAPIAPAPEF